jgi:DNA-binding XRE family transcriptional regulator
MTPEQLKKLRLRNMWAQSTLAKKIGVSTASIVRWERGECKPSELTMVKVERWLDKKEFE